MALRAKPLALFFLGIIFFCLLVYYGLNITEQGLQELMALEGPSQALRLGTQEGRLIIVFAGKKYSIPYGFFLKKLFRSNSVTEAQASSYFFTVTTYVRC
jgi:hypothetical protein